MAKDNMKSEKEKMLAGELYDAADPQLAVARQKCRLLLKQYNDSDDNQIDVRENLLRELLGAHSDHIWIEPPFYCDYGWNISVGEKVYMNFNCLILDVAPVNIGSYVQFGPNVQVYTATHPLKWQERANGLEFAKPISIGDHVWIGGGAIILPGVQIGDRAVIGAGSVVTNNIPADTFAAGNPCRVIRELD